MAVLKIFLNVFIDEYDRVGSVNNLLLYMDVDKEVSQPPKTKQDEEQTQNIKQLLIKLAANSLKSSQKIFNLQTYQTLLSKFKEIHHNTSILDFIEEFISTLLNYVNSFTQQSQIKITTHEYRTLQKALQKSEGEIRKHYKVEQQLKIYLDNLEDKIQQLQDKLEMESQKYLMLFQTFKELDQNHQKILIKLQHSNHQQTSSFNPFNSLQGASNENIASRKTKLGLKNKILMEKLQQRTRNFHDKNKNKMLNITDDENLKASTNQMIYKRNSIDRYKKIQNQSQIKQLTKSLQMKQGISIESYKKKISKTKTETNQRQGRSNSILN